MKITDLDKEIKAGKLKQLYFFYGPETFLMENKINSIKVRIVQKGFEEFGFTRFNGSDSNFDEFKEEFYSYPMSGEKKLIVLQNTDWFSSNAKELSEIKALFAEMPQFLYIIIREDAFDKRKEKNIEFIKDFGGNIVEFDFLPVNQICIWIEKMFSDCGKDIKQSDAVYIANACSCQMQRINEEVKKLIIFSGEDRKIHSEDVYALVTKTADFKIYELFDDIMEKRKASATEKLKNLFEAKEKPTSVIFGLTNRFSELLTVKLLNSDRLSISEIKEYLDYKAPDFVIRKMISQSKAYSEPSLKRIIKKGIESERMIKSGKLDAKLAAEMFVSYIVNV